MQQDDITTTTILAIFHLFSRKKNYDNSKALKEVLSITNPNWIGFLMPVYTWVKEKFAHSVIQNFIMMTGWIKSMNTFFAAKARVIKL